MAKQWRMLIIMGGLALLSYILYFPNYHKELGDKAYYLGILAFVTGAVTYEVVVFAASFLVYFIQAILGDVVVFQEIHEIVFESFSFLCAYVIINMTLALSANVDLASGIGWFKLLYVPIYVLVFITLKRKIMALVNNTTCSLADAVVGTLVLIIITGI